MEEIKQAIQSVVKKLFDTDVDVELTRPNEQFGDYATNIALQLGKRLKNPPAGGSREVAEQIVQNLKHHDIAKTEIAGPGFINITLTDEALCQLIDSKPAQDHKGKQVLVEFGDPNPFKEMHLGHLYTAIVGDAIAHLLEASGAQVKRLSYHGDVGMHVAKWLWGRQHAEDNNQPLGYYYAIGAKAFEEDSQAVKEIQELNKKVYEHDTSIKDNYDEGKTKSFEQFDIVFKELDINYDKRYLESQAAKIGIDTVRQHTGKVFEESQGAVIYKGEKAGLHTRVFITSQGLPTYEAKDLGLVELKNKDFPNADRSIIITADEQSEYFKVMLAALADFDKPLANKTIHLAHGFLSLTTGKMSSRTGQIFAAADLLKNIMAETKKAFPKSDVQHDTYLAAVKYSILKHRIGGDIVFDVKESISLEGNSGPYLQYAHARARSILKKSHVSSLNSQVKDFDTSERTLLRKIGEYGEVVDKAIAELMPHHVATYLYELAQAFNSFYEHNRVVGDKREPARRWLVENYADTLKNGLNLLNISAPEKM